MTSKLEGAKPRTPSARTPSARRKDGPGQAGGRRGRPTQGRLRFIDSNVTYKRDRDRRRPIQSLRGYEISPNSLCGSLSRLCAGSYTEAHEMCASDVSKHKPSCALAPRSYAQFNKTHLSLSTLTKATCTRRLGGRENREDEVCMSYFSVFVSSSRSRRFSAKELFMIWSRASSGCR